MHVYVSVLNMEQETGKWPSHLISLYGGVGKDRMKTETDQDSIDGH